MYTWEPLFILYTSSLPSASFSPSPSLFPIILLKDSDHSHLTLNLYVCIQRSFWGCIFVHGCPINLSATSKAVCTMQGGDHNDVTFTCTEIQPIDTTYKSHITNDLIILGLQWIHKTCVIMPDDAVLLKAVAGFVHLKQSRWTLVPGLCNCCWSVSKHCSHHPWSSRHPWNFGPLYPSRPPAHPKAPFHLLLISRSDTLN